MRGLEEIIRVNNYYSSGDRKSISTIYNKQGKCGFMILPNSLTGKTRENGN